MHRNLCGYLILLLNMGLIFSIFFIIYICGISSNNSCSPDNVTYGTELVITFLVHRHGDRTPLEIEMNLITEVEAMEEIIRQLGYGELTNVGMQRGYDVGKFIRRRYNDLLSSRYKSSEIYVRSTDSTRTQMTALTAMAAVYPAFGETWNNSINWVPVPYTTVPIMYDFNEAVFSCPAYTAALIKLYQISFEKYKHLMEQLSFIIEITLRTVGDYWMFYNAIMTEKSLGYNLDPRILALMPQLEQAAEEAFEMLYGDERYVDLISGVLLHKFFDVAELAVAWNATPRVIVYSAHDFNVYSFATVAQVTPKIGPPKFGSIIALELRRVVETGSIVVLPVFIPSPELKEQYLQIDGCGGHLCDYNMFYQLTSKHALNESDWKTKCKINYVQALVEEKIISSLL